MTFNRLCFIFLFFLGTNIRLWSQCSVKIGSDTLTICNKSSHLLSVSGAWNSYKWSNGSTTATTNAVYSGSYDVEVTKPGCVARDTIFIQFFNLRTSPDTLFQCELTSEPISADTSGRMDHFFQPFNLSSVANFQWSSLIGVDNFPTGSKVLNGVPFDLKGTGNMAWAAEYAPGNNPKKLVIKVGKKGCLKLHTLINTMWGLKTSSCYAYVNFYGNGGKLLQQKKFYSDNDFRDYQKSPKWANNINNNTTKNIWMNSSSSKWLDMQTIVLDPAVQNTVLDSVVFLDYGTNELQRMVIYGVTIEYKRDVNFQWSHGPTNLKTQSSNSTYQQYVATVFNSYGSCKDTVFTKLMSVNYPKLRDTFMYCMPITIGYTTSFSAGTKFEWNTLQTGPTIQINQPGIYTVKITNSSNCSWFDTINVVFVNDAPKLDSISGRSILRLNELEEYKVLNISGLKYTWDVKTASFNNLLSPFRVQLSFGMEGWHKVKLFAQSKNGCTDSIEKDIFVISDTGQLPLDTIYIPNAFNPDGINTHFKVVGIYLRAGEARMKIFDRWGGKIFEGDALAGWDGCFSDGQKCPTGLYIYIVDALNNRDRRIFKGQVLLVK